MNYDKYYIALCLTTLSGCVQQKTAHKMGAFLVGNR